MSNTYTVWGMGGATRLLANQHHMAGVLGMHGGLGDAARDAFRAEVREAAALHRIPVEVTSLWSVRAVQNALKRRGHDPGRIDGKWGPATRAAMDAFWKAQWRIFEAKINAEEGPSTTTAQRLANSDRIEDSRLYWAVNGLNIEAADGADGVRIPMGQFETRLFAPAPASSPPRPRPTPDAPPPPREEPPVTTTKEETDWTTWAIAGGVLVLLGVGGWALSRRRKR
jgi:LPXTG-motif cell wall-anchored protein